MTDERVTNASKYLMNEHIRNEGYVEHSQKKKKTLRKYKCLEEKIYTTNINLAPFKRGSRCYGIFMYCTVSFKRLESD